MSQTRQGFHRAIATAVILSGIFTQSAFAQIGTEVDSKSPSTLFFLIHSPYDMTAKKLKLKLAAGLDQTVADGGCKYVKLGNPEAISPTVYESIRRMLGNGLANEASIPPQKDMPEWKMIPDGDLRWEFKLPEGTQELQELTIEYDGAKSVKYTKPKGKGEEKTEDEAKEFRKMRFGSYSIPLLNDAVPKKYSYVYEDYVDGKLTSISKPNLNFPEMDRYFFITISGFSGRQDLFFKNLADENVVPNAFKSLKPVENYAFALASLMEEVPVSPPPFDGTNYDAHVAAAPKTGTRRVWMKFPLTKKEAEDEAALLQGKSIEDIPDYIRSQSPIEAATIPTPAVDGKSMPPSGKYFELPTVSVGPDKTEFRRKIPMVNFPEFATNYPIVYRVVVREFDSGKLKAALEVEIEVVDETGKKRKVKAKAVSEDVAALSSAIKEKVEKDEKDAAKKNAIPKDPAKKDEAPKDPAKKDETPKEPEKK